jgi:hypothetical protein
MVEFIAMSSTGQALTRNSHLDVECTADNVDDGFFGKMDDQFGVEEACKVAVESFVVTDEFTAKTEARHESMLLEPVYGAERAREEMPLKH